MRMPTMVDPYLISTARWALNHSPCVIACTTLMAVDIMHAYLLAQGHSAITLKGSDSPKLKQELLRRFDEEEYCNYLVTSISMLNLGGFRLTKRENLCLATTALHTKSVRIQLAARINIMDLTSPRLMLRGVK